MKWLNYFFAALKESYTLEDRKSFPFEIRDLPLEYRKLWLEKVLSAIKKTKDAKALAADFNSVNEIRVAFVELLKTARQEKHPDTLLLCNFFYSLAKLKVKNCPFSSDGKNIKYSYGEIKSILANTHFIKPGEPNQIGLLSAYLHMLAWNLHTDSFPGIYYHGPYKTGRGILIVREFFDLKCEGIWHGIDVPFDKITLLTLYNPMNVKLKFYTEMVADNSFNEELIEYGVLADGKPVAEIKKLSPLIKSLAYKQKEKLHSLKGADMKKKFIEIQGWRFRHLFNAAGMDWKPDSRMMHAVVIEKPVKRWDTRGMSKEKAFERFKEFLDPRK